MGHTFSSQPASSDAIIFVENVESVEPFYVSAAATSTSASASASVRAATSTSASVRAATSTSASASASVRAASASSASADIVSSESTKGKRKYSECADRSVDAVPASSEESKPQCAICLDPDIQLVSIPCHRLHPSDHLCNNCLMRIVGSTNSCPICRKQLKKLRFNLQPNAEESIFAFWERVVGDNQYAKGTLTFRDLIKNTYVESPFVAERIKRFRQYPDSRNYLCQIDDIWFDASDAIISIHEINELPSGCFTGDAKLTVCEDSIKSEILLKDVVPGMDIEVACGVFRKVRNITVSDYFGEICVLKNGLKGTPYHPVKYNGRWIFMKEHPELESVILCFYGKVYSLQFEEGVTQGVLLNNISCAVLGHGVTDKKVDATLGHPFFGDWDKIDESLNNIQKDILGRSVVSSFSRDVLTGDINCMH